MHDPMVLVFTLHLPIPQRKWKVREREPVGFRLTRLRYTGGKSEDEPLHPAWRPAAYSLVVCNWRIRMMELVDVWHDEPGGEDSGTVCEGMGGSELTWHNVKWALRHREHLTLRWQTPLKTLHRWWTQHCADCGQRFGMHEARYGAGWDSSETLHNACLQVRSQGYWIADLEKALSGEPLTATEQWRIGYRLKHDLEWNVDGTLAGVGVPKDVCSAQQAGSSSSDNA